MDFKPLVWNETLDTGISLVDNQHQILVNILNTVGASASSSVPLNNLWRIVGDLASYGIYHFQTEEDIMKKSGYNTNEPEEYEAHLAQHRSFVAKIGEFQKRQDSIDETFLVEFLQDWLVNHILTVDKKLGDYVASIGYQYK